jgi:hypothetical protein
MREDSGPLSVYKESFRTQIDRETLQSKKTMVEAFSPEIEDSRRVFYNHDPKSDSKKKAPYEPFKTLNSLNSLGKGLRTGPSFFKLKNNPKNINKKSNFNSLIQMNSSQIGKLAIHQDKESKPELSKKSMIVKNKELSHKQSIFHRNKKKFKLPKKIKTLAKNPKIDKMKFKAFKTFDRTCVNLFKVKDTLRYHHQRMLPIIMDNLKKSEFLVVEENPENPKT